MDRLFNRVCAILILSVALLSLRSAYLAAAMPDLQSNVVALARLSLFGLGGLASVAVAAWLWSRPVPSGQALAPARLFGRDAVIRRPERASWLRPFVFAIPIVMLAALVFEWSAGWREPGQGAGIAADEPAAPPPPATPIEVAVAPPAQSPEPPAAAVPEPPAGAAPEPPPPAEPPAATVPFFAPPAVLAEPPKVDVVAEPPTAEPPQEIAGAPPATEPPSTEPPETVAPLPPPIAVPTQSDGHHDAVMWISLSPDGRTIASASIDTTIKLWNAADMRLVRNLGAQKDMARAAIFLPDGASVLTAGDDGEIVQRSVADGAVIHVFSAKDHGGVREVALSRDGKLAVSVHEAGTVIVWDIANRKLLHVMRGHSWSGSGGAISPDGSRALSGSIDGELMLWDVATGRELRRWQGHDRGTYGAAFTPDGRFFVTGSGDMTIKLWNAETQQEIRRYVGHSGTVYDIAISADGKRILSGSLDGTARLWDLETGKELAMFAGHVGPVFAVAFGPDGTAFSGGEDRTIRRWQLDGAREVAMIAGASD